MSAATLESASRPPRILQVVTQLGLGGAEAVTLSIVRGLPRQFDFGVLALRGIERSEVGEAMRQELTDLGIPLFCGPKVSLRYGGMIVAGVRSFQIVRQFNPALVHLHSETPESAYAAMLTLPRRARPGIIRTIHSSNPWQFWPALGAWCERRLRASHVACVSGAARAAFERHRENSGAGPLPAPPVIIYNGVSLPPPAAGRTRNQDAPWRLLFAGRFAAEKGADLLPAIIRQVRAPAAGAELVAHGEGPERRLLETFAAQAPKGWSIHVRPPTADLRQQMRGFDLVVVPSRLEGLSLVAIEAALAGVPVVTTDAVGLREALPSDHPWRAKAGDAGSFSEHLQRALDQRERWPEATARAMAFARERFDYQTMLDAYAALYTNHL